MNPTAPIIEVKNLVKSYGKTKAVKSISFQVGRGEVVGFLGPNGAGKSTTMKILDGFIKPSSGSVRVLGIDVQKESALARRHIGYLPENNPLYDEMMVSEYLDFVAEMRLIPKPLRKQKIQKAVESCRLTSVLGKDIGELSKGFCQRVGLAQAILHDPELLILDEPASGLDPNQIIEIRSLIKDLGKEKTVLMSTHILSEAQSTCSRILIINEGRIVADDNPEQLAKRDAGVLYLELMLENAKDAGFETVKKALSTLHGVKSVKVEKQDTEEHFHVWVKFEAEDLRADVFKLAVEKGWVLLEMRPEEVSLEKTFRSLTSRR